MLLRHGLLQLKLPEGRPEGLVEWDETVRAGAQIFFVPEPPVPPWDHATQLTALGMYECGRLTTEEGQEPWEMVNAWRLGPPAKNVSANFQRTGTGGPALGPALAPSLCSQYLKYRPCHRLRRVKFTARIETRIEIT